MKLSKSMLTVDLGIGIPYVKLSNRCRLLSIEPVTGNVRLTRELMRLSKSV